MNKVLPIFLIFIIVLSGINVGAGFEKEKKPIIQAMSQEEYDMVILAPNSFSSRIQALINHKEHYGLKTFIMTTEEIYSEFNGRDKPEQIKFFIKDSIEKYNIKYVLLIGGLKSLLWGNARDNINHGTKDWYLPVRY